MQVAIGVWKVQEGSTRLGGCGAVSQVKKVPLEWRSNIPQNTDKRLLVIISSSGLWDPGNLSSPGLLDVRLPLSLFSFPASAEAVDKLQRDKTLPTPSKHAHSESGLS